jgi:hypothetical protein
MDVTLTGVADVDFTFAIVSFDVQHAESSDNFFSLI